MDWLSLTQASARGAHLAGELSVFGVIVFQAVVLRPPLLTCEAHIQKRINARLRRLLRFSAALAVAAGLVWLPIQTSVMSGETTPAGLSAALGSVLGDTAFGHAFLIRLSTLALATALAHSVRPAVIAVAVFFAGISAASQSEMAHVVTIERTPAYFAHLAHVLAAGAWLGGLLPLRSAISAASPRMAAALLTRFSRLAMLCVAVLAVTALALATDLIGNIPRLVGTDYGLLALGKAGLFALLLALAAINKFVLTPAYRRGNVDQAAGFLHLSILTEVVLGLALIGMAASLAMTPPAIHQQPVWPFDFQFATEALDYPPLRHKLIWSGAALGCGALLMLLALVWSRARWPALAGAAIIVAFAPLPRLGLLFKTAHPDTYITSPTGFSAISIAHGAQLYRKHCAACHGADGKASADAASRLRVFPPDLAAARMWWQTDGDLFWQLSHGIDYPAGGQSMPGFADILSPEERWNLIDYLRAKAAGAQIPKLAVWPFPVPAPALQISCADGRVMELAELRGQVVRVAAEPGETSSKLPSYTGITVMLSAVPAAPGANCFSLVDDGRLAYAIIGGLVPEDFAGTQFLIDANGWLRLVWRPGQRPDLSDPAVLAAEVKRIQENPVPPGSMGSSHH